MFGSILGPGLSAATVMRASIVLAASTGADTQSAQAVRTAQNILLVLSFFTILIGRSSQLHSKRIRRSWHRANAAVNTRADRGGLPSSFPARCARNFPHTSTVEVFT